MKNFKLKLFSLVLCTFMLLSVFTGCSLFVTNDGKDKNKVELVIGEEQITREELSQLYYSFYSQNSSYFYYYGEEQIADLFYRSVIASKLTLQEAKKLIANNTIVVTDEDYKDIWKNVFDYFDNQVTTAEKAILTSKGAKDEDLPKRLQTSKDSEEKAYKYEPYKFEKVEYKPATGTQATAPEIDGKIPELKARLFKYNTSKDKENPVYEDIAEAELKVRNQAYEQYISSLVLSAKANNKDTNRNTVIKTEVERVFKSYYESKLQELYQDYINSTSARSDEGYTDHYSNAAIVKKFKELLNASTESNTVEDNYIEVVTSTDNDTLILYHYNGKYKFFSVQHVLISYSDEILSQLKNTNGYDAAKDLEIRNYYEQVRAALVGGTSDIENMETTYRDDDGYTVKDANGNKLKITIGEIVSKFNEEANKRLTELHQTEEYIAMNAEQRNLADIRVRTLLFNEFAWKYSGDTGSLTNDKLAGVLGFTITSENNNHGSFVKDFTNGAREMYASIEDETKKLGEEIKYVVSDYGVHMMMITGVYEPGELVKITGKSDDQIVEELKNNYVSNLSTQTLYEYVYDLIKDKTVGDNGTFYADFRNAMLKKYTDEGKVKYKEKLTYEQLNNLIK